ncbi:MAG: hypothetical protein MZW92_41405 [Comamonadaceae bacterium]|nr:hypothetical protein [Comamonadaceae bacterium]
MGFTVFGHEPDDEALTGRRDLADRLALQLGGGLGIPAGPRAWHACVKARYDLVKTWLEDLPRTAPIRDTDPLAQDMLELYALELSLGVKVFAFCVGAVVEDAHDGPGTRRRSSESCCRLPFWRGYNPANRISREGPMSARPVPPDAAESARREILRGPRGAALPKTPAVLRRRPRPPAAPESPEAAMLARGRGKPLGAAAGGGSAPKAASESVRRHQDALLLAGAGLYGVAIFLMYSELARMKAGLRPLRGPDPGRGHAVVPDHPRRPPPAAGNIYALDPRRQGRLQVRQDGCSPRWPSWGLHLPRPRPQGLHHLHPAQRRP